MGLEHTAAYIPADWRQAMALGRTLPESTQGTALFADISGFTPLTEALTRALGLRRGAEALPRYLNQVYDALIAEVDRYGGSVIGFAGDAITCWFADDELQDLVSPASQAEVGPLRAAACALAMQQAMRDFSAVPVPGQAPVPLAVKVALASGPARRFLVGDPNIQLISTLAGATLARMAAAEHLAGRGEVVADGQTAGALAGRARIAEWRPAGEGEFAVLGGLRGDVEPIPWPVLDPDALSEAQVRPWVLPPVYARLEAGLGEFLTELRPAVAVFLRFAGIDYDGDEQAGAKLDAYVRWVQATAARCEGILVDITIGDKGSYLYVAFGAPMAHEDDPLRAVTTAHELRTPPAELAFVRQVQIGVSQGTMRTGAYGGTTRRTYGVLGDETNFAARLMQHAAPGEALISPRVQKIVADAFQWETLPPIKVKGKTDLVAPARLMGPHGAQARAAWWRREPGTPLVGRDGELAQLESVLEQVLAGRGQILRLEGGRGVGKGRLALAFARRAADRGVRVCVGSCQSTARHILYAPWRPIFRDLLSLDGGDPPPDPDAAAAGQLARLEAAVDAIEPEWRIRLPLLGDLLGLPIPDNATTVTLEPRLRQEALFTFAVELVQAQARVQPLLLLLLDAHWMDEASQALVMALGRVAARAPVLLMPVHRSALTEDRYLLPELDQLDGYYHLALGPLAPEAIAALVAARLAVAQDGVSRLAMSLIQARAQGMVFFAEALVEALREGGHLALREGVWDLSAGLVRTLREANCLEKDPASGAWLLCPDAPLSAVSLDIPDSIHGIVLSRVDRLPETHKATLKVASVVGRVFELEVLGAAHPARLEPEDLQAQQAVLEQRDFVRPEVPGAVYAFANNALQEVVYETLPGTQQRELHGAVGAALEGQQAENVERLAYHYGRATDKSRDRAMFYLDKAAHKAQREYANETALNYYNQALALEERWQWRKGQTETLHILGRRELEKEALRVLEKLPEAPAGDVAYLWGEYHEAVSDYAQAQDAVERALAASREGADRVGGANCLAQLGLIARRQGDYEGAKGWYGQALDLLRGDATLSLEESLTLAPALIGLGIVHRLQGEFDEATACYEQALDLSRESGNRVGEAQALNSLGVTAQYQRQFRQALAYFRQAIEITRAIGDRVSEGLAVANVARCCAETGDYSQAEIYLGEALSHQQAMGNKWAEVNAWNQLGILYQELGDLPRSHDCLSQGLLLSQEIGDQAGEAYLLANLGLVAHDQGNLQAAESLLLDGLALAETQADKYLISVFATYLSSTYLRLGRYAQTIEQASGALALRRTTDLHLFSADNLATLASAYLATADRVLALDYALQALAILDECGGEGPEFPQQDYFTCYQVLQACGQTEAAQHALDSAYGLVMKHAQKIVDPAMRQSFLERVPGNRQIVQEVGNAKHRDQGPGRI